MPLRQPKNQGVLRYLEGRLPAKKRPAEVRNPTDTDYWEAGAHPEIVERLWDQLGARLPLDCRRVIWGSPALLHPTTGLIFGLAMGTSYVIRLAKQTRQHGLPHGVKPEMTWSSGERTNIQAEFGKDWTFGSWNKTEEAWVEEIFRESSEEAGPP
jgi:hypothetical protein